MVAAATVVVVMVSRVALVVTGESQWAQREQTGSGAGHHDPCFL